MTEAQILSYLESAQNFWSDSNSTFVSPATITYDFSPNFGDHDPEDAGGHALNATQQAAATLALTLWDDLIAPTFAAASASQGDIELAYSSYLTSHGSFAYTTTNFNYANSGPDLLTKATVWFGTATNYGASANLGTPVVDGYNFMTFMHELGHALGLSHQGNYNGSADATQDASGYQDSSVYTIMSYFGPDHDNGQDSASNGYGIVAWGNWEDSDGNYDSPQTPMLDDIMAIQDIYGASTTTRTGDTIYGFNSTITGPEAKIYDFTQNANPILCIWDSSGNDTIDLSGYSTASRIDLHAGSFSDINGMTNNLSIAYNCVIENATTGSGNDTLIGNDVANVLKGGGGNDTLTGNGGNDTLDGGAGIADVAVYTGTFGNYTVVNFSGVFTITDNRAGSPDGTDTDTNIEIFRFSNGDYFASSFASSGSLPPMLALDVDSGHSSVDKVTNDGTVDVSGVAQGATWEYSTDSGTTWTPGSGSSFTLTGDGAKHVLVHQITMDHTVSGISTLDFTLDTTAPDKPTLALANDTGSSAVDNITSIGTVSVGVESDASWEYSLNSGAIWTAGTGNSIAVTSAGANTVEVRQTDQAGNISDVATLNFTVDTTVPAKPTLALAHDTGSSATDKITSDGTVNVSGLEANATWEYSTNNGTSWTSGAGSSFVLSGDGSKLVVVRQYDQAGNMSATSTSLSFKLDATAPVPPANLADTGIVNGVVNAAHDTTSQALTGTAEAGTKINIYDGATLLGSTTAGSAGAWKFTVGKLADGPHSLTAQSVDIAGNASTSGPFAFTVDTIVAAPSLALATDTGIAADGITSNGTVNVSNLVGVSWSYSTDGKTWKTGDNSNSLLVTGDGSKTVYVRQTDAAGNVSANATLKFVLDTKGPAAPSKFADASMVKGYVNAAHNTAGQTLTGTAEANSTVTLYDNGVFFATAFAMSNGLWGTPLGLLSDGTHAITAQATDVAGNPGAPSTAFNIVVDTVAPTPPLAHLLSDTGVDGDTITKTATLTGTAETGALITLKEGTSTHTVTTDSSGNWTYKPSSMADGAHNFAITQTDLAGNVSSANNISFTLDTKAPVVALTTRSGHIASVGLDTTTSVDLSGTGEAGAAIQVFDGKTVVGTATVDNTGHWTDSVMLNTGVTSHAVTVTATDTAGNSKTTSAVSFVTDNQLSDHAGTSAADHIIIDSTFQTVAAGSGDDTVTVKPEAGTYHLDGGSGIDTIDFSLLTQALTVDLTKTTAAMGASANGTEFGSAFLTGFENIIGGDGANTLTGDKNANLLVGGAGADTLTGGAGNDTLTGGGGADTFVFAKGFGKDAITDFSVTDDFVNLDHTMQAAWKTFDLYLSDSTAGAVFKIDASDTITFTGLTKADFLAHLDHFQLV